MIDTRNFVQNLRQRGVTLFTGVPDSLLQGFSACLLELLPKTQHIIAANEGNAIGLAMGHYLATGQPGVVYLQNSGLGNTINPLTSLADPEVYGVPMLLIIGWRGEPGKKDEPQHVKQGRITPGQLELLEIPYWKVDHETDIEKALDGALESMSTRNGPSALLIKSGALGGIKLSPSTTPPDWPAELPPLYREAAVGRILELLSSDDCVVATTGKTGREVFELRAARGEAQRDFLTVGGMGHASSIALGIALAQPDRGVVCLDGDGSMLMHLGSMAINGDLQPTNLVHVLLNNQAHESVGGQPTVAGRVDFEALARACGYQCYTEARSLDDIREAWKTVISVPGPHLLEIHLWQGSRSDLGRPTSTPSQNKSSFMAHLGLGK
jgi:phosphonopyruvate decarboxylase